jgi:hypothetical protein
MKYEIENILLHTIESTIKYYRCITLCKLMWLLFYNIAYYVFYFRGETVILAAIRVKHTNATLF